MADFYKVMDTSDTVNGNAYTFQIPNSGGDPVEKAVIEYDKTEECIEFRFN